MIDGQGMLYRQTADLKGRRKLKLLLHHTTITNVAKQIVVYPGRNTFAVRVLNKKLL